MLYMTHNLKGNFINASGFGDRKMQCDILMSELAKTIVYRPETVKDALKRSGIEVKDKNYSSHELCSRVTDAIYKSPRFAKEISKQILITHLPTQDQQLLKANGGGDAVVSGVPILSQGMGEHFGGTNKDAKKKSDAEKDLKDKTTALGEIENTGPTLKKALKWGIGLALVGTAIFGIYKCFK